MRRLYSNQGGLWISHWWASMLPWYVSSLLSSPQFWTPSVANANCTVRLSNELKTFAVACGPCRFGFAPQMKCETITLLLIRFLRVLSNNRINIAGLEGWHFSERGDIWVLRVGFWSVMYIFYVIMFLLIVSDEKFKECLGGNRMINHSCCSSCALLHQYRAPMPLFLDQQICQHPPCTSRENCSYLWLLGLKKFGDHFHFNG